VGTSEVYHVVAHYFLIHSVFVFHPVLVHWILGDDTVHLTSRKDADVVEGGEAVNDVYFLFLGYAKHGIGGRGGEVNYNAGTN